jgi:hypothetical protein
MGERPSHGARDRLASVPKRASPARRGAAIRTERLFGAPLPLGQQALRGRDTKAPPPRLKVEHTCGAAERWLFDR